MIPPYVTELFAVEQVGPWLWGKHWIPGLTNDQRQHLKTYGLLGESADVSDLLRQQDSEKDAPAERQALTAARLQQALMLNQRQAVHAWLDGWALRKYPGRINRAQLDAALAAAFPKKKGGNHSYDDADVVAEMRHDLDKGLVRSLREAATARLHRVEGASPEAKAKRLVKKASRR